jgi:hypothetical protein
LPRSRHRNLAVADSARNVDTQHTGRSWQCGANTCSDIELELGGQPGHQALLLSGICEYRPPDTCERMADEIVLNLGCCVSEYSAQRRCVDHPVGQKRMRAE